MAKRAGAYKSEKRKKELTRQKKQEEKRQRRLSKGTERQDGEDIEKGEDRGAEAVDSASS